MGRLTSEIDPVKGLTIYQYNEYHDRSKMLKTDEEDTIEPNAAYLYDHFNQLNRIDTEGKTFTYKYNGDGLRSEKTLDGVTTKHIYDGPNIVMELDSTGKVTAKYIRGLNLIYSVDNTRNRRYYLYNGHGDVEQLTDANGNVIKEYKYDSFGNELVPDTNDTNPFRYAGEYFDKETRIYYLRARYYDPATSCMLTEDPIRSGLNWYVYCNNNPIMFIDPLGLEAIIVSGSEYDVEGRFKYNFIEPAIRI